MHHRDLHYQYVRLHLAGLIIKGSTCQVRLHQLLRLPQMANLTGHLPFFYTIYEFSYTSYYLAYYSLNGIILTFAVDNFSCFI